MRCATEVLNKLWRNMWKGKTAMSALLYFM